MEPGMKSGLPRGKACAQLTELFSGLNEVFFFFKFKDYV